jgi:DNA repair exonuclease SbcCD ATPase subunit
MKVVQSAWSHWEIVMAEPAFSFDRASRRNMVLAAALGVVLAAGGQLLPSPLSRVMVPTAAAQQGASPSDRAASPEAPTADDEFSRQLKELKQTFADLSKKFEDSAKNIDRLNNAEDARKEIEELREQVGTLLGAVADNGAVWSLGAKALARAEEKLRALERETRYRPEDRQFLIDRWRELKAATENAIGELEGARKDFAELLRKLQTSEDFIDELLQIREHQRALEVIHQLTDGIRDASEKLKKLLGTIKTPGA